MQRSFRLTCFLSFDPLDLGLFTYLSQYFLIPRFQATILSFETIFNPNVCISSLFCCKSVINSKLFAMVVCLFFFERAVVTVTTVVNNSVARVSVVLAKFNISLVFDHFWSFVLIPRSNEFFSSLILKSGYPFSRNHFIL